MSRIPALTRYEKFAEDYINLEKTPRKNIFWLDTMRALCVLFSHPENCCPSIHIAGSKGKGSISKMAACALHEAGYKTGLYMSPHVSDFCERIGEAEGPFSDEVYEKSVSELCNKVSRLKDADFPDGRRPTWFELTTLLAMLCFRNAECDIAVYEVGMGGRLDSTNVIHPLCSVISKIELEHQAFLGDTLEKIAGEKAGIIKTGVPVVISRDQEECVQKVLTEAAREKDTLAIDLNKTGDITNIIYKSIQTCSKDKTIQNTVMNCMLFHTVFRRPLHLSLNLIGDFQADNALSAAVALKTALPGIDEAALERGISCAALPGRFEVIREHGAFIVLDGAHTVQSVKSTLETLQKVFTKRINSTLLFALAYDKRAEDIAPLFKGKFSRVVLTTPGEKPCDFPRLKRAFKAASIKYTAEQDPGKALTLALAGIHDGDVLFVTGSFYLVSEVKRALPGA